MLHPHAPAAASGTTVLERPILRLGLLGFGAAQRDAIARLLAARPAPGATDVSVTWELSGPFEADTWWINGTAARLLGDGTVTVADAAGAPLRFDPALLPRPVAWAAPLPSGLVGGLQFDARSPAAMENTLLRLEGALRPLVAQLCLASQLLQREGELQGRVYHVHSRGRLLAVVDLRGDTFVRPTAGLRELSRALWTPRPDNAVAAPEDFARASLSLLMWQYAVRTREDLLPYRYRVGPIHFRRTPRVPPGLMQDLHLLLLQLLREGPHSFRELLGMAQVAPGTLAHALAALYLVGGITSNPLRSRSGNELAPRADTGVPSSITPSGLLAEGPPVRGGRPRGSATLRA